MDVKIEIGKYYTWEPFIIAGKPYHVATVKVTKITRDQVYFQYAGTSNSTHLSKTAFLNGLKPVSSLELFLAGIDEA